MIAKVLSANDVGETKSHQAGILIPKNEEILSFFPLLEKGLVNPRKDICFRDDEGNCFHFSFIYYNNRFYGGTRNEYRLTCVSKYIRMNKLKQGDIIKFQKEGDFFKISSERASIKKLDDYIKLSNNWITINLK